MRRLIVDLDDILFLNNGHVREEQLAPLRQQLMLYRAMGFQVVLSSSSGMIGPDGSPKESVGGVGQEIFDVLALVRLLYDEVAFGKPPTGPTGLVLDDKAVTPEEFLAYDYVQIKKLISGD